MYYIGKNNNNEYKTCMGHEYNHAQAVDIMWIGQLHKALNSQLISDGVGCEVKSACRYFPTK